MVAGYTFPATLTDPKLMNLARPAHANPCTTPKKNRANDCTPAYKTHC